MFKAFFGAALALTLWGPSAAFASVPAVPIRKATPAPTVAELYSLRARRRMATYLRLRLLEWREQGLERAADVVERRLSVDVLVPKSHSTPDSAKH